MTEVSCTSRDWRSSSRAHRARILLGEAPVEDAGNPNAADLMGEEWQAKYVVCTDHYSHFKLLEETQNVSLLELKQIKLYEANDPRVLQSGPRALVDLDFFDAARRMTRTMMCM